MNLLVAMFVAAFAQDLPLKPKDEFEIKLDYQFKQRPTGDSNTVTFGDSRAQRASTGVLPYLILHIKMLSLPDEKTRINITNNLNQRPVSKRISLNDIVELDMGFTADMIDRVQAHEYTLTLIDAGKTPVERIVINVAEDGSFFVNGEKRGRF